MKFVFPVTFPVNSYRKAFKLDEHLAAKIPVWPVLNLKLRWVLRVAKNFHGARI